MWYNYFITGSTCIGHILEMINLREGALAYIWKVGRLVKNCFVCSLIHNGILGGALLVDDKILNYKTGKVTVDARYRDLVLRREDIVSVSWKWVVFPVATFEMKNGEKFRFLIFNKWRFRKVYEG